MNPDLVAEGRRLHDAERAMDEGERWSISGSQMDLLAWSRNNLPALLDEAEKVPTLEAKVIHLANARQLLNAMLDLKAEEVKRLEVDLFAVRVSRAAIRDMKEMADAEIARLREALEHVRHRNRWLCDAELEDTLADLAPVVEEPK